MSILTSRSILNILLDQVLLVFHLHHQFLVPQLIQQLHVLLSVLYLRHLPKQDHTVTLKFIPCKGINYSPVGLGVHRHLVHLHLLVFLQDLVLQPLLSDLVLLVPLVHLEVQLSHLVQVVPVVLVDLVHLYFPLDQGFQQHPRIKIELLKHYSN